MTSDSGRLTPMERGRAYQ